MNSKQPLLEVRLLRRGKWHSVRPTRKPKNGHRCVSDRRLYLCIIYLFVVLLRYDGTRHLTVAEIWVSWMGYSIQTSEVKLSTRASTRDSPLSWARVHHATSLFVGNSYHRASLLQKEWDKRWEGFYRKLSIALLKYHAITLTMRAYEYMAEKCVDLFTMDKLTLDIVDYANRHSRDGKDKQQLAQEMISVCWNANLIYYLADFSVHQAILVFGYYVYIRKELEKQRKKQESKSLHLGSLTLSLMKKTTLLALSRGVELGMGALGGAMGTLAKPGLGTLAGFNVGDSFAISLTDNLVSTSP